MDNLLILLVGGGVAVSLFFILSGYLIGSKASTEINKTNGSLFVDGLKYAFAKAKKIAPLYYIMLLGSIPYTLYSKKIFTISKLINSSLIKKFFANIFFIQSWIPDAHYAISFNWPCWFLSTLMFFYILTPLFRKYANKMSSDFALILCILIWMAKMVISFLFIDCTFTPYDKYYYWFYISPLGRISDFTCGILFAKFQTKIKPSKRNVFILEILGFTMFLIYAFLHSVNLIPPPYGFGQFYIPISLIWIYVFINAEKGKIAQLFINNTTKFLGDISSDFYIIHRMALCYFAILKDHLIKNIFGPQNLASPINIFLVTIAFILIIIACIVWKKIQNLLKKLKF